MELIKTYASIAEILEPSVIFSADGGRPFWPTTGISLAIVTVITAVRGMLHRWGADAWSPGGPRYT
jgi:hypothetical protein